MFKTLLRASVMVLIGCLAVVAITDKADFYQDVTCADCPFEFQYTQPGLYGSELDVYQCPKCHQMGQRTHWPDGKTEWTTW